LYGSGVTQHPFEWVADSLCVCTLFQDAGLVFAGVGVHSPFPVAREIVTTCAICGDLVRSAIDQTWKPSKKARKAQYDMQEHLMTHSFAELLRHEIRQDLDQVPDEQRPAIVRDVYRGLLGTTRDGQFALNNPDAQSVYSIEEALGDLDLYRLWRSANRCGDPGCTQH
jgi:hypothetical protein